MEPVVALEWLLRGTTDGCVVVTRTSQERDIRRDRARELGLTVTVVSLEELTSEGV